MVNKFKNTIFIIIAGLALFGVIFYIVAYFTQPFSESNPNQMNEYLADQTPASEDVNMDSKLIDFSKVDSEFLFTATIPNNWDVTYSRESDAINIYDPSNEKSSVLDKSNIFIKKFTANSFLTLNTVNIIDRVETQINSHPAVRYEIVKKSSVPNFPDQPFWRNTQHKLIDIRYQNDNPSVFYVFSYNPDLPQDQFEQFINSLIFHNDSISTSNPLTNAKNRITKKPFGIQVSPTNSPVSPERFSGFHTGTDFEIFPGEENTAVSVTSICDGNITSKRRATGYGGLVVQSCLLNQQSVHVVYGHLDLNSISAEVGDLVLTGQKIANLAAAFSQDSGNERKHLHLSINLGPTVDISGYVTKQSELSNWLNFEEL